MKVLHANNPAEVASASSIEVAMADPGVRLMILSGIAIPERRVNDDEHVYPEEVLIKLGVNVGALTKAVSHIGLASIANDETAFVFAVDTGVVEVEPGTGELQLRVATSLMGEDTYLHRFGYQVVAHVRKVDARIAGTIKVPRAILDVQSLSEAERAGLFAISANRIENVPQPPGYTFPVEKVIPVAWGSLGKMRTTRQDAFIDYTIDACPFNVPLRVQIETVSARFAGTSAVCGQSAGPRPVTLTNTAPAADGVDFVVSQLVVR